MNWTREVVCVPVTDVVRAKACDAGQLGCSVDHDREVSAGSVGPELRMATERIHR